jgi:peptidoglycan biosynthesis protein MviN/MurJ (putative lipid II flippase)
MGSAGDWELSKGLARAILYDRGERRKWLGRLLMLAVAWMALGLWVLDGWLSKNVVPFLFWWGFCFLLASVLVLFALYDALAVIREEREKSNGRLAKMIEEPKHPKHE